MTLESIPRNSVVCWAFAARAKRISVGREAQGLRLPTPMTHHSRAIEPDPGLGKLVLLRVPA